MNLASIADEIATQLDTIAGLRAYAWPPGDVKAPAAIVGFPSQYTYDQTYGRGSDRLSVPVVVLVPRPTERPTRDALGKYCDGSGASSVKAVLEAGTYTACDSLRVVSVEFDVYQLGATDYAAAIFDIDVFGPGS